MLIADTQISILNMNSEGLKQVIHRESLDHVLSSPNERKTAFLKPVLEVLSLLLGLVVIPLYWFTKPQN